MKIKLSEIAKKIIKENESTPLMLNGKAVDEKSIEIDGIDRRDYPDFSDAYISAANYMDGTPLSDKEIEELDDQNNELVHEKIQDDQLYMQEGEEEKLGGSAYDKEDREEKAQRRKKSTCRVCKKPFTPSYGEYHRCPSCMNKQHSAGETTTGTQ